MTAEKVFFMFSGQGSQHYHMARALFDRDPIFSEHMMQLDNVARELTGESVVDVLYANDKSRSEAFDDLATTHPAIFMVEYALAQAMIAVDLKPDFTLGTSLGAFAAAAISGLVTAETALATVIQQAAALEACCDSGTMIAVLTEHAFYEKHLEDLCELAAVNFASHFVVSTTGESIEGVERILNKHQVAFQRLPVNFAFHSRWIDAAAEPFASYSDSIKHASARVPLICCEQTAVLDRLPKDFFWRVVREPIRFGETIKRLEREHTCQFIDLGPSGTLATFLRHILPATRHASVHSVLSPYGRDHVDLRNFANAVMERLHSGRKQTLIDIEDIGG